MSRNHKKIIIIVLPSVILVAWLSWGIYPFVLDRYGPGTAHAAVDNTKEVMATCITDAKDLWLAASGPAGKVTDGDKIAIAAVASKLFEARYLLTYIEQR